ncbi:hypothetical protein QVD17_01708 [Tagetes erecta]|uniref:U1-type domain-containing protein n=1 Tax=Tagetes erecta TaxID=13708 RepID=A0AAD8L5B7_TARER|nr:hypothetical protein QVD17_01708 [Tagetes erecta]
MDLSKHPDSQRQQLEQLQKQFHEQQSSSTVQQQQPTAYDPFHVHHHQPYDPSYYYNYQNPSQQHQYDASNYQTYYSNSFQQHETPPVHTASNEQHRNEESGSGSLGLGQVQDPYANLGYTGFPGVNPAAAAAAMAALSQLTQFAGAMGAPLDDHGRFRPLVFVREQALRETKVGRAPYRGGGRRGGGPFRGGGRGNPGFRPPYTGISGPPFHGRGRGRGRDRRARRGPPSGASSSKPESSSQANSQAPGRIAWCELCKVDCTSNELLDQHNNGRRHKKNLQKLEQMGAHQPVVRTENDVKTSSDAGPEENKNIKTSSDTGPEENKNIPENKPNNLTEVGDDNNKEQTEENGNQEKKPRPKRKMKGKIRGGGSGKRMRPMGPRIPKVVIPLVCDLCNIKCDTQEVFDRHAAGKKHMSKLKRFAGHQAMYGPTAVQALYPPNPLSQTLAPQPTPYYAAPSSYPEAYIPPPHPAQNPNPQLADAPLEFSTQNAITHAAAGNGVQ